jgi:Domain of unknown function (DUF3883)
MDDSSSEIEQQLHRVSFREIKMLWSILSALALGTADLVRARFLQSGLHYSEVVSFLAELGFLRVTAGKIRKISDLSDDNEKLKQQALQNLLTRETRIQAHTNKFLSRFKAIGTKFEIVMDKERRQQFSGVRNVLLDLDFLERDFDKLKYWISAKYTPFFIESISAVPTSAPELQAILRAREQFGHDAEIAVLKFERHRLRNCPNVATGIDHVSAKDVSAGYDIHSFTKSPSAHTFLDRRIEVKAVSVLNWHFYWSRNEIEAARKHGRNYFLYLVPALRSGFDIANVKIIQNPFKRVDLNAESWCKQEELASFWCRMTAG